MRSASLVAAAGWPATTCATANSSPPKRATASTDRTIPSQPLRHEPEQRVADGMAECIVDVLEAVEVQAENRDAFLLPVQRLVDLLLEEAPVRQVCQPIVARHVVDARFRSTAVGDVLVSADPASARDWMMDDADGAAIIELDDPEARLRLLDQLQDALDVLLAIGALEAAGLQATLEHFAQVRAACHHMMRQTVQLAVSVVADDQALAGVEHHQADRHVVDRRLEMAALALGLLGQPAAVRAFALHAAQVEPDKPAEQRRQKTGE